MNVSMFNSLLERCALTLEQHVAPELSDEFALAQVRSVTQLLRTLAPSLERGDEALQVESAAMSELLANAAAALEPIVRGTALEQGFRLARLTEPLAQPDEVGCHARLKERVVHVINLLEQLPPATAAQLAPLRQQVRTLLRLQLDNELAHLTLAV